MKKINLLVLIIIGTMCFIQVQSQSKILSISKQKLKDKIAGGWAGKMIGVTYGAPTEFRYQQKINNDSIKWTPADIKGSVWQDDIYVQLTFMMAMDKYGMDAPAVKYQEMLAKATKLLIRFHARTIPSALLKYHLFQHVKLQQSLQVDLFRSKAQRKKTTRKWTSTFWKCRKPTKSCISPTRKWRSTFWKCRKPT